MVDRERVIRLLDRIHRDRDVLGRFAGRLLEGHDLDAVKYRFITAIGGCARVAHHLTVSEGWSSPDSNADAFTELASQGVIDTGLARRLVAAAGFRNVLVHQYAEVDDDRVVANLERLGDFDQFIGEVGDWMKNR